MAAQPLSDELRNELIRSVQGGVPFVERPFADIAERLGLGEPGEAAVIAQLERLSEEKVLREISAVLEGSVLGYDSALVAGVVPEADLERVVEVVNAHPTVTHNYLRNHHYNLWFTIAVPPEMKLEKTLELLAHEGGIAGFLPLRRTHTFKIGVNFDLKTKKNKTATCELKTPVQRATSEIEQAMLRALQTPLTVVSRPFDSLAASAGVPVGELLAFARGEIGKVLRRYVATFHHRRLGVRGNGMVVWNVDPSRFEHLGPRLAQVPEVSHCYARNPIPGFDYTLYSMTHGPDRAAVEASAARTVVELDMPDYLILFSTREFKKTRLRYFLTELDQWWEARTGESAAAAA